MGLVFTHKSCPDRGLCTRNVSRALIERPYSREPQAVGAVYDRPGFFVQSCEEGNAYDAIEGDCSGLRMDCSIRFKNATRAASKISTSSLSMIFTLFFLAQ